MGEMPKKGQTSESKNRGKTLSSLLTAFDLLVRLQSSGQNGPGVSLGELANELSLSKKQINRYLDALEEFGAEFDSDPDTGNRNHPVRLSEFRNQRDPFGVLILNRQELTHLYAHLAGLHHAGSEEVRQQLWHKVTRNLGVEFIQRKNLEKALGTFNKADKSYDQPDRQKVISSLLEAIYKFQVCNLTYCRPNADPKTYRNMEPYQLIEFDGGLYCFFHLPWAETGNNRILMLAIERIKDLSPTGEMFEKANEVTEEIEDKKTRAFRIEDDGNLINVKLKFNKNAAFYVMERVWHSSEIKTEHKNGTVTLEFTATGRQEIERWIRSWGDDVEVVKIG